MARITIRENGKATAKYLGSFATAEAAARAFDEAAAPLGRKLNFPESQPASHSQTRGHIKAAS